MEKNTEKKKKLSGWDRKKMKGIATCGKLDSYFACVDTVGKLGTPTASALESQSEDVSTVSFSLETRDGAGPVEPAEGMDELIQMNSSGSEDFISLAPQAPADYHPKPEDDDERVRCILQSIIDIHREYPTDPHLFCDKPMTPELIRTLLELGPCQPGLKDNFRNFPKDEGGRHFSPNWYKQTKMKSRGEIERHWLIYSPTSNSMFCFPCWLFDSDRTWSNPKNGCNNFAKGIHKIEKHENCDRHKKAEKELFLTKFRLFNDKTVLVGLLTAEKKEIEKNRNILKRIIDAVLFLGKQGLAFRGHREYQGLGSPDTNEGNFLELIKLLAKNDATLEHHLQLSDRNATYLSPDIQNDLIQSVSAQVLSHIVDEINVAKYFAVIVDSTIDISRTDQFSLSIRYVTVKGDAVERFIKFCDLPGASAEDFFNTLVLEVNNLGLSIKMCYGQSYDGASTMAGAISGLQARIKEVAPNALFTHCCAHNLNLILVDAVSSNNETQLFFGTLEGLYTYFSGSLPRLSILKEEQRNHVESFALTLKKLSDTRWASRKAAVQAVLQNLPALVVALQRIVDGEIKNCTPKQLAEARGILVTVDTYEFLVLLIFWNKVLEKAFKLSTCLQNSSLDLVTASRLIQIFENDMKNMRNKFESEFAQIENEATKLAQTCDINTEYKQQRRRKRKRFHEETAEDEGVVDGRKKFIVESYLVALDSVINSTSTRFDHFKNVASKFSCLDPKHFDTAENVGKLEFLADMYSDIIESPTNLVDEFLSFKDMHKEIMSSIADSAEELFELTINNVLKFMIANGMCSIYPNLSILYKIFLTLPINSAGAERSFSRLKLIKSYVRSTMGEERLSGLSLISIERQLASEVDCSKVIDHFARMKPRRKKLL